MRKKHSYSAVDVERVESSSLKKRIGDAISVGIDVAKERFVAAFVGEGTEVSVVKFRHPQQTAQFIALLDSLRHEGVALVTAMEPTGTYGDAVRWQLERRGFEVRNVSPKATHDAAEVFDGVPSLHDGKCAVLIAKLHKLGRSEPWPVASEQARDMRALLEQRRRWEGPREQDFGALEALLSRHWPEFGNWLDVRGQKSALALLHEFGGPVEVAQQSGEARATLRRSSKGQLAIELIDGVLTSAVDTLGLPPSAQENALIRLVAGRLREATLQMEEIEARIEKTLPMNSAAARLAPTLGVYTAAVVTTLVDPLRYANARAYEKACGLNLRVKSSGEDAGKLRITKRGHSRVRQVLYLAALRRIQIDPIVAAWYRRRKGWSETSKLRATVAVMRKLVKALWHVARGETFDAAKLFDTRRLELESAPLVKTSSICSPRRRPRGHIRRPMKKEQEVNVRV